MLISTTGRRAPAGAGVLPTRNSSSSTPEREHKSHAVLRVSGRWASSSAASGKTARELA